MVNDLVDQSHAISYVVHTGQGELSQLLPSVNEVSSLKEEGSYKLTEHVN